MIVNDSRPDGNYFLVKTLKSCAFSRPSTRIRHFRCPFLYIHTKYVCIKSISAQSKRFKKRFFLLDFMFAYRAGLMCAGLMRSTFFCGEPAPHSGLEYILPCFYSLMRFRNESVFTEIFLKHIKENRSVVHTEYVRVGHIIFLERFNTWH